jgi:hypothetical protein
VKERDSGGKKKMVYIWDGYPLDSTGNRLLENIKNHFDSQEIIVILWNRSKVGKPSNRNYANYTLITVPCSLKKVNYGIGNIRANIFIKEYLSFFFMARKLLCDIAPGVIICAEWKSLGILLKKPFKKCKIIYLVKDMPRRRLSKIIEWFFLKMIKLDLIWTHSPFFNRFYRGIANSVKAIRVLPPRRIFRAAGEGKDYGRNNLKFLIIFNGTIRYLENLIATSQAVEAFNGKIEFHVYGYGQQVNLLEEYIEKHCLRHTKYHGRYEYMETPRLLRTHDCVSILYPSDQNAKYALANKLYEAILFERPVLATKGTKTSEIIRKYNIGACVSDPKDPASVKTGIEQLLKIKEMKFADAKKWIRPYEDEFREAVESF